LRYHIFEAVLVGECLCAGHQRLGYRRRTYWTAMSTWDAESSGFPRDHSGDSMVSRVLRCIRKVLERAIRSNAEVRSKL
jgi:hypothetical protein